ncbi:MAG: DNA cytosine methyltransferase [Candidatus Gastranaerophilales bacterium]
MKNKEYNVGELFAGIGGIGLGFKKAGFNLVWANEIDEKACITYSKNFQHLLLNQDMTQIDPTELPKIDILTGGFPCQAFSVAGHRKGFKDERGNLFFDIMRYVKILKPKVIFLENVKNLTSHDNGTTFKIIQEELKKAGYYIKSNVLNTSQYSDIPQNRERIYIVCFNDKALYNSFCFPRPNNELKEIRSLLEKNVSQEFSYSNSKYFDILKKEMKNPNTLYQWRRVYVRENKNNLCPTLTANMGTGGHNVPLVLCENNNIRKLTPRECARFQGYPDDYILPDNLAKSALYKQIGNSVSVPVITAIAQNIMKVLQGEA